MRLRIAAFPITESVQRNPECSIPQLALLAQDAVQMQPVTLQLSGEAVLLAHRIGVHGDVGAKQTGTAAQRTVCCQFVRQSRQCPCKLQETNLVSHFGHFALLTEIPEQPVESLLAAPYFFDIGI